MWPVVLGLFSPKMVRVEGDGFLAADLKKDGRKKALNGSEEGVPLPLVRMS